MESGTFRTHDGGTVTAFYFERLKRWRFEVRDWKGAMTHDGTVTWGGEVRAYERREPGEAFYPVGERF